MHMIHIVPKFFAPYFLEPELVDIEIPELGLTLLGGEDVTTRKPYPNKRYFVACRKKGRKAVNGILIESPIFLKEYTVTSRWSWEDNEVQASHVVKHVVLDSDFDMTSDDMLMWYGTSKWEARWPEWAKDLAPANVSPCMEIALCSKKGGEYEDEYHSITGHIMKRTEIFKLPTIERERFLCQDLHPMPNFEQAFKIDSH